VNLAVRHKGDYQTWDWQTPAGVTENAALVSEPRVVKTILGVTTLRQARYGIIDAKFSYDVRIE
jgi:hypothetical protein